MEAPEEENLFPTVPSDGPPEGDDDGNGVPPRARRYIADRCDGASKLGEPGRRPPCRPCLPPPCVKWCPSLLEQNPVCESAGRCGIRSLGTDAWRRKVFGVALASNVAGMALTIASCWAISLEYDALMAMGFSAGRLESDNPLVPNLRVEIGLRGVAVNSPLLGNTVWTFDEFCDRAFRIGSIQYFGEGVCTGCAETSAGLVSTLVMAVILYLPNIFTDVTRMYSNYDVNCQKASASFVSFLSLLATLYTWAGYVNSCFSVFYEGIVPFDRTGNPLAPNELNSPEARSRVFVNMDFEWRAGNGLICVVAATALKFVDILCNWLVPTPSITRNKEEQAEYEDL